MRIRFECPTDFIKSEVWEYLAIETMVELVEDNENPECIILNPGSQEFYGESYFKKFKDLKVVGTPSTGVNHIDCEYLNKKEIKLYSLLDDRESLNRITASAEFTWLHIMNLVRNFSKSLSWIEDWRDPDNERDLRSRELSGKKIGIIGFGRIGKKLKRYAEAFEMQVKFYDPYVQWKKGKVDSLEDLNDCDIISINCYLTEETNNMITYDVFKSFKDGLIVVNTSRGEVVDEDYILDLVEAGKINYACDVLKNEQNIEELKKSKLYRSDKVVITPHIAGVTVDSQTKALEATLKLCMK